MARPKGSSVLMPFLRKLAENPNEYGEGKLAVEIADLLLLRLQRGEPVQDILKALERTDGAVKAQIEHTGHVMPTIVIEASNVTKQLEP